MIEGNTMSRPNSRLTPRSTEAHNRSLAFWLLLSLFPFNPLAISPVYAQAPFYQGQTIKFVVGYLPGDGYDIWARIVAPYLTKYIPGNPNVVIQNMPGAGSMIAANYVYGVAKGDGLTLGAVNPSLYLDQLIGRKEVQFDWAKFTWIGSPESTDWLFYIRSDSPYKSVDDLRRATEPPKCSATSTGSSGHFVPRLLEETLGAKLKLVMGYKGGSEQDLAFERGETDCRSVSVSTFFAREPFGTWRKKGLVRILVQTGRKRDAKMPDVPTVYELLDKYKAPEQDRQLAAVIFASGSMGRPVMGSPGIPRERTKLLRDAYTKSASDPEFQAEVKKKKLDLEPVSGEELETIAREVSSRPPDVVERMKKVLGH